MENLINNIKKLLFHEKEVAVMLSVSAKTLQNWRTKGKGPDFIKAGHSVRYELSAIQKYIAANRRASTSSPEHKLNFIGE